VFKSKKLLLALSLTLTSFGLLATGSAKETLVVDLVNEPASLDPHLQWNPDSYYVYRNIFDNLLARDDSSKIVPNVATSWEYVDETIVDFSIRDDIVFHDGTALTAHDVVFSIERITDPEFNSPQLGQFNKITSAEALDDRTVRVTTDGPYPVLLSQLVKLSIVPQHVVEEVGDDAFAADPVGSGPYEFSRWHRGVQVVLQASDDYWGGEQPFETVEFHAVPDVSTRVANLVSGKSDIATSLTPDQAKQVEAERGVEVLSAPTERLAYVLFNTLKSPTDDIEVRRALAASIDPKLIVDALLGGYGEVTRVMLTPVHSGYTDEVDPFEYDLEAARQAKTAAGDVGSIQFNTAPPYNQNVVQALQQFASQAGLAVEIVMRDMPTHLQLLQGDPQKAPNMNFGRWSCACLDADGVLYPLFHSESPWSKYRDPQMDRLLEAARNTIDEQERDDLYQQVLQKIRDEVLALPLYQVSAIYGAAEELRWQPTPDESMFIMRMSWQE
jgi:peptide/nickel transport system substrate-binding protein